MKIDYPSEYKKQLGINISLVRKQIDNQDFVLKISNHAEKFGRKPEEIRNKILSDDMFAEIFAKDPSKQNIYEKLAADYIKKLCRVKNFVNLPNNAKMFVVDGKISNIRLNDVKSIDFHFQVENFDIYASHKYTKATGGGAQDHQYNEVRNYLRNCGKVSSGTNYYIAICDGPYYDTKIEILRNDFSSNNVRIMTIEEVEDFIMNL